MKDLQDFVKFSKSILGFFRYFIKFPVRSVGEKKRMNSHGINVSTQEDLAMTIKISEPGE